jgi:hypothetical protein
LYILLLTLLPYAHLLLLTLLPYAHLLLLTLLPYAHLLLLTLLPYAHLLLNLYPYNLLMILPFTLFLFLLPPLELIPTIFGPHDSPSTRLSYGSNPKPPTLGALGGLFSHPGKSPRTDRVRTRCLS